MYLNIESSKNAFFMRIFEILLAKLSKIWYGYNIVSIVINVRVAKSRSFVYV